MNKKLFVSALLALLSFGLASCGEQGQQSNPTNTPSSDPVIEHSHQWANDWMYDDENHWHECIDDDCTDVNSKSAHVGGTATCTDYAECDDCGALYGSLLPHNFKSGYSYDANNHWQVCDDCDRVGEYVAHEFNQKVESEAYLASKATHTSKATYYFSCVCGKKGTETFEVGAVVAHTPDTKWHSDETSHWHECTVCEDVKLGVENHAGGTATCTELAVCEDCGVAYGELLAHSYKGAWLSDETSHWQVCEDCEQASEKINHLYNKEVATEEYLSKEATHLTNAEYFLSCECGAKGSETFEVEGNIGHVPSEQWYTDGENHWQVCTYDGCDAVLNKGAHEGGNASCTHLAVCDVCNVEYGALLPHEITEKLVYDGFYHWYACANCGGSDNKVDHDFVLEVVSSQHFATAADHFRPSTYYLSCSCGAHGAETFFVGEKIKCTPVEGVWHSDNLVHWLECECGQHEKNSTFKWGTHFGGTATCIEKATCDTCKNHYGEYASHVPTENYLFDIEGHWLGCQTDGCDHSESYSRHEIGEDGKCIVCDYVAPQYLTNITFDELLECTADYNVHGNVVFKISGVVQGIFSNTYGNFYLVDIESGKMIMVYGLAADKSQLTLTDNLDGTYSGKFKSNNKQFAPTGVKEGDYITMIAICSPYNSTPEIQGVLESIGTWDSPSYDVVVESYDDTKGAVSVDKNTAKVQETVTINITPKEGYIVDEVTLNHGINANGYKEAYNKLKDVEGVYSFSAQMVNKIKVTFKEAPSPIEGELLSYVFAEYEAGTQYAIDELHVLDENTSIRTTESHFTTQLRLYASSTHDGFAIIESKKAITQFNFNAGNNSDNLVIYGSINGVDWVLVDSVAIAKTYDDYEVVLGDSGYTYLKLDVAGSKQLRIVSFELIVE